MSEIDGFAALRLRLRSALRLAFDLGQGLGPLASTRLLQVVPVRVSIWPTRLRNLFSSTIEDETGSPQALQTRIGQ